VQHEAVAEAAVVGFPHEIKGEGIFCYVILKEGREDSAGKTIGYYLREYPQSGEGRIVQVRP
jgi:acyl-coenzyme A synthetase/AMP-(fatty) acid ligase